MALLGGEYIEVGVAMTPPETIPPLDTIHIKCFFGYLVKIILNSSFVKKKEFKKKYLKNKLFIVMFHLKFVLS